MSCFIIGGTAHSIAFWHFSGPKMTHLSIIGMTEIHMRPAPESGAAMTHRPEAATC
jgi:hypothetical protein